MDLVKSCRAGHVGRLLILSTAASLLGGCNTVAPPLAATRNQIIISVRDQKLTVVKDDHTRVSFPISTSKFGLGDRSRSYETPTGEMAVAAKIGGGAPAGAVFHGRVTTGEIVKVDAPGRDAIVTRILALKGLEANNAKAFSRGIYIHGTPEERNIGRPTSYGCIRMRSRDVIALYEMVKVGARVQIIDSTQNNAIAANIIQPPPGSLAATGAAPASPTASVAKAAPASTPGTTVTSNVTVVKPSASTAPNAPPKKIAVTTTTTIVTPGTTAPPPTVKTPGKPGKKEWAGAPAKLLDEAASREAKAKVAAKPPTGAPFSARPVSNNQSDNADNILHRGALDSL